VRFAGVLEELNEKEAVSRHPLHRLDEEGSQVQPVAGLLVLASSYEGLELRELLTRREAAFDHQCFGWKVKAVFGGGMFVNLYFKENRRQAAGTFLLRLKKYPAHSCRTVW